VTGEISYYHSDGNFEELPSDIYDGTTYIAVPSQRDLGLGKPLALRFASENLASDYDAVDEIFCKEGAYGRFKDLLERRQSLDAWYAYETNAIRESLVAWCEEHEIEVTI